jgi:predicted cupin superfamily sugar epimerase
MNKKQFLELLIKSYGLIPKDIKHYRTDGCDGQYEIKTGWRGAGVDKNDTDIIQFWCPDGFEFAVFEILKQADQQMLIPELVNHKQNNK